MPKYVIEREMPGIGQLSATELQAVSQNSLDILAEMGSQIRWLQSYVTENKIYSLFMAENEVLVRQHAQQTGLPVNRVSAVVAIIDPNTAEE